MSDLRKQLQSLKAEYQSAKYPGSLADELLPTPARPARPAPWSRWRIGGYVTVATGIAAAIVISLLNTRSITQPPPAPTAVAIATTGATTQESPDAPIMPIAEMTTESFPDDIPLVPSGESLVPTAEAMDIGLMPSFPSFDFSSLSSIEEEPA